MDATKLREVPLFSGLATKDLEAVARCADDLEVPAGRVLARQGEIGHEFFLVEAGAAEVVRDGDVVGRLSAGDFFGEMALISGERRTATVTASEPMTVAVMTSQGFRSLKRAQPEVYENILAEVARRRSVPS